MIKKPRENRIPIMMSDDELSVIDDWRFENRVATRSSAIRQLCYRGLEYDKRFQEMEGGVYSALLDLKSFVDENPEATRNAFVNKIAQALMLSAYVGLNHPMAFDEAMQVLRQEGRMPKDVSPAAMLADFVAHYGPLLQPIVMPVHPYFEE